MEEDVKLAKEQIELHERDVDFRFRPWLYPRDPNQPIGLHIAIPNDSSSSGLDVLMKKEFVNDGTTSTRSVNIYITFSNKIITGYKANAYNQLRSAIFPRQKFLVENRSFLNTVTIGDDTNHTLSEHIFISILLDYEYGDLADLMTGSYQGIFRIDKLGIGTVYMGFEDYSRPHIYDLKEYAE